MRTQITIRPGMEDAATRHYRESEFNFHNLRMSIDPDAYIGWEKNTITVASFDWGAAWHITNAIKDFFLQDGSPLRHGDIIVKSYI